LENIDPTFIYSSHTSTKGCFHREEEVGDSFGRGEVKGFFSSSSPHTLSLTGSNSNPKEKIKTTPPFLTLQEKRKKNRILPTHTP
jgi:hypothetical protein